MPLSGPDTATISPAAVETFPVGSEYDPGSYRDRAARVCRTSDGRILRSLSPAALREWQAISPLPFFLEALRSGRIVGSQLVQTTNAAGTESSSTPWAGMLEHEVLPFISYPYEWTFSMLRDAALLHLELLQAAVTQGCTIKDGTAYNVQFRGSRPTFIDVTSFEQLRPGTPWMGYRQFCQTFLFPLMLQAYRQLPFQPWLRGRLDGITPQECWQAMSMRDLTRRGVMTHVALHALVEARTTTSSHGTAHALSQSGFHHQMILNSARHLQRTIAGLRWSPPQTNWSNYGTGEHYSAEDSRQKDLFVRQTVHLRRWKQVWDLGGNIGHYAEIAAENADSVIVVDADHAAIEQCYLRLKTRPPGVQQRILPLVASVVDLPGGLGWRGRERRAFTDRGRPELILCLALIHHVVIGHGVPLPEFIDWLADLGAAIVIEFVGRDDPKVQQMLRDRRDGCDDYAPEIFETAIARRFHVQRRESLMAGRRTLVYAEPRR